MNCVLWNRKITNCVLVNMIFKHELCPVSQEIHTSIVFSWTGNLFMNK